MDPEGFIPDPHLRFFGVGDPDPTHVNSAFLEIILKNRIINQKEDAANNLPFSI